MRLSFFSCVPPLFLHVNVKNSIFPRPIQPAGRVFTDGTGKSGPLKKRAMDTSGGQGKTWISPLRPPFQAHPAGPGLNISFTCEKGFLPMVDTQTWMMR